MGPGAKALLTQQAQQLIDEADLVYGSRRQLDAMGIEDPRACFYEAIDALIDDIKANPAVKRVILASGDPLLYGIGSTLRNYFDNVTIVCGISSLHYFFSKIDQDMNEVYFTSAHGRKPDFDLWFKMPKLAAVTDKVFTPAVIARAYANEGLRVKIYVGTSLSTPDEMIVSGTAEEIQNKTFQGLAVVVIVHER